MKLKNAKKIVLKVGIELSTDQAITAIISI